MKDISQLDIGFFFFNVVINLTLLAFGFMWANIRFVCLPDDAK